MVQKGDEKLLANRTEQLESVFLFQWCKKANEKLLANRTE
jgi:hypothetical protein